MSKLTYTPEFKAMVSQEYLDGLGSYGFLANKYQIGNQTLNQWVTKYRLYGIRLYKKFVDSHFSDYSKEMATHPLSHIR